MLPHPRPQCSTGLADLNKPCCEKQKQNTKAEPTLQTSLWETISPRPTASVTMVTINETCADQAAFKIKKQFRAEIKSTQL